MMIRLCTLNCNGLRKKNKRNCVFRYMKENKIDVVCIQESHVTEADACVWQKEWGGSLIFSQGSSASKGQLILIKSKSPVTICETVHKTDRILAVKIAYDDHVILVCNVYAPNDYKDKVPFLDKLFNLVNEWSNKVQNICVVGDFNMVMSNKLDIISGNDHKKEEVELLNEKMARLDLNDTWRLLHEDKKEYTWHRKNPMIARRLDYIFCSSSLFAKAVECEIRSAPATDHRAIVMDINFSQLKKGPSYWKLNNALLKDLEYVEGIHGIIDKSMETVTENTDYQMLWDNCKIKIREYSIRYSKKKAQNRKNNQVELRKRLDALHVQTSQNPDDTDLVDEMERVKMEMDLVHMVESKGAQVRAKAQWIEKGEKSTKYFLGLEKSRANYKVIVKLRKQDGDITEDQNEILDEQYKFYKELYKKRVNLEQNRNNMNKFLRNLDIPQLSNVDKISCEGEVKNEEAASALKDMKNGSSPGPDGLTSEFYKCFWGKIKSIVVKSFNEAFSKGKMSITQRKGIITLILKGKNLPRHELSNWRPITLTNTDYKILAKILAKRLQRVIKSIVGNEQCGYIKGRNIGTIIRLIDDVTEYVDEQNESGALLALDYTKAFDSISKEYLTQVFSLFGFGEDFIHWVDVLNNGTESSVQYCGWQSKWFEVQSGIRQGCPFSPLAFILAVEIMALKIRQKQEIVGINLRNDSVKIAQYADDTTLFMKDEKDIEHAINIIEEFALFSGLRLNRAKTMGMWLGKRKNDLNEVLNLNWKTGIGATIKILGVVFSNNKVASEVNENWEKCINKILENINRWEKRDLSIYGKVCITKVFLISQLVYLMQGLIMPDNYIKKVNRIIFKFLWKKRYNNRKAFEKVKRVVVCSNYENGGLKMINIEDMQKGFILNWVRKLSNESGAWKLVPNIFYEKLGKNLSVFKSNTKCKNFVGLNCIKASFWRKVLEVWIENNKVTDEESNMLSEVIWNNDKVQYRGRTVLFQDWIKSGIIYLKDMVEYGQIMSYNRVLEIVGESPGRLLEYNVVYNALPKDWQLNLEGPVDATLKFCGNLISKMRSKDFRIIISAKRVTQPCAVNFWKRKYNTLEFDENVWLTIFDCTTESRLRILQWKILHNIYPTNILLKKMRKVDSDLCVKCQVKDYMEHFFINCSEIKGLWKHIERDLTAKIGKQIVLTEENIIFGITEGYESKIVKLINLFIIIGKMCISKVKYGEKKNIIMVFEFEKDIRKNQWVKYVEDE